MARTARTPKNARATAAAKRKAAALLKRQQATFLSGFEETHLVTEACKRAGIHRQRAYEWRASDSAFAAAWAEIEERSTELLEREAYRRAAEGWIEREEYEYVDGEQVVTERVRKWSDTLLIFLLKARRPQTYRELHRHEHVGADGGPVNVHVDLDEKQRKALSGVLRGRPASRSD